MGNMNFKHGIPMIAVLIHGIMLSACTPTPLVTAIVTPTQVNVAQLSTSTPGPYPTQTPTLTPWPIPATSTQSGFLPGIGFVENPAHALVLLEPALLKKAEITMTVEQGISDGTRTVIIYRANGLSVRAANSQGEGVSGGSEAFLRLPDGTEIKQIGGEGPGWGTGYRNNLIFPPLPEGIKKVTFVIPRLESMPPGSAPENWEIPISFAPLSNKTKMLPVYDLEANPALSVSADGIDFKLERVAQQEDGYLFEGSLSWNEDDINEASAGNTILMDAGGQKIPIVWTHTEKSYLPEQGKHLSWAFRTHTKDFNGPLTLKLTEVPLNLKADVVYQFDPGLKPHLGQSWDVNQSFKVGNHTVRITTVKIIPVPLGQGIEFTITGDQGFLSASALFDNPAYPPASSFGGPGNPAGITQVYNYIHGVPPGPYKIKIGEVGFTRTGLWQIQWNPPPFQAAPQVTHEPQPCLTLDQWRQIQKQDNLPLPAGLTGKFLLYGKVNLAGDYGNIISSLDGKEAQLLGEQMWASLSPDGSKLAFDWQNGLAIQDIYSGKSSMIPGTGGTAVYHPLWSPDGHWIAFNRLVEDNDIFIVRPDGSGLKQVTHALDNEELFGWTPDGQALIITAYTPEGEKWVRSVNINSGKETNLISLNQAGREGSSPHLSPDGQKMVYSANVFGQNALGLYLSRADGTQSKLITALDYLSAGVGSWSPDGKWLAVNVHEDGREGSNDSPALIDPETCQIIPLFHLRGTISDWVPLK